jgi:hypothetical protein
MIEGRLPSLEDLLLESVASSCPRTPLAYVVEVATSIQVPNREDSALRALCLRLAVAATTVHVPFKSIGAVQRV